MELELVRMALGWAVPFALGGIVAWVGRFHSEQRKENEAIRAGVRALLYDRITQAYVHYHDDLGYIPLDAMRSIQEVYENYHSLGGNGVGKELFERLKELPTSKKSAKPGGTD